MAKEEGTTVVRREIASILTPELVDVQGKNDREFLATRVKLLLDAKQKHPSASFADIANLADLAACGCGCCCCCGALVLPGSDVVLPQK